MWIEHGIFITCVDLEQMFKRVDITDDELIQEGDYQVLVLDFQLKDLMLELNLSNQFLGVEIQSGHLETSELLFCFFLLI
jgi:hypothetical protein